MRKYAKSGVYLNILWYVPKYPDIPLYKWVTIAQISLICLSYTLDIRNSSYNEFDPGQAPLRYNQGLLYLHMYLFRFPPALPASLSLQNMAFYSMYETQSQISTHRSTSRRSCPVSGPRRRGGCRIVSIEGPDGEGRLPGT